MAKAARGTVVSDDVAMDAPVEAPPRPLLVSALSARFCAAVAGASDRLLASAALLLLLVPAALVVLVMLADVAAAVVGTTEVVGEMIGALVAVDALALLVATA